MLSNAFLSLVAILYYVCFTLLAGMVLFIAFAGSRRSPPGLRRTFILLALSLLVWQLTLFLEVRTANSARELWLGRINFAAIVLAAYWALRFAQHIQAPKQSRRVLCSVFLQVETWLLAMLTLLSPWIDITEHIDGSEHATTTFGVLFPWYLVHVVGYLCAALALLLWKLNQAESGEARGQLTLTGIGMLVTGGIAIVTNAVLPYGFHDFRYCDTGTLSTVFFVLAVAYATFIHGLFDLRTIVRETLVYGILMAFVLGTYSSTVFLVSQYLTNSAGKVVQFAVLVIAFSLDPLRRFLEKKTDRLLFGDTEPDIRKDPLGRESKRLTISLVFPWRRP